MKFKIICVIVIAASLALILGLTLTGNGEKSVPETVKVSMTKLKDLAHGKPVQPGDVVLVPDEKMQQKIDDGVLAPTPESEAAVPAEQTAAQIQEKNLLLKEQQRALLDSAQSGSAEPKDEVDYLLSTVNSPEAFSRLPFRAKISVISLALKMNEEQEVMLASYLEASDRFKRDPENARFAMIIRDAGVRVENGIGKTTANPSISEISSMVDIMALELKEIRGLKDVFIASLTQQQKEKFETLAVAKDL